MRVPSNLQLAMTNVLERSIFSGWKLKDSVVLSSLKVKPDLKNHKNNHKVHDLNIWIILT